MHPSSLRWSYAAARADNNGRTRRGRCRMFRPQAGHACPAYVQPTLLSDARAVHPGHARHAHRPCRRGDPPGRPYLGRSGQPRGSFRQLLTPQRRRGRRSRTQDAQPPARPAAERVGRRPRTSARISPEAPRAAPCLSLLSSAPICVHLRSSAADTLLLWPLLSSVFICVHLWLSESRLSQKTGAAARGVR